MIDPRFTPDFADDAAGGNGYDAAEAGYHAADAGGYDAADAGAYDVAGPSYDAAADDSFERSLRTALAALGPVPEPPRELMWARIDAARRPRRGAASRRLADRPRAGFALAAALAAMLALGIGIGRGSVLLRSTGVAPVAAGEAAVDAALPYRVAAMQHLSRTEALFTSLPASAASGSADEVAAWAGELLSQTRLLLDSPAGEDAELGDLLADLELLLAQVAALSAARGSDELDLIRDGIDQNDVMLRLRTATMVRPFAGT